ncbi:uncharacterized protein LOC132300132 [Cornus florida]|uniref:uncharacterized protein LOC132300132 n=1 Tax=Cornus florida TaxID=4283 RepID=UPI00289A676F|nr:uncharacterized protein LOC132300132 [Cornus florida]XP_059653079.1 uncharacterized protein LOC132300132 [Cornus florida]
MPSTSQAPPAFTPSPSPVRHQADAAAMPSPQPPLPAQRRDQLLPRYAAMTVAQESYFDTSYFDTAYFSESILTRSGYQDIMQRGLSAIFAPVTGLVYPRLVRLFFQHLRPSPRFTAEMITTLDGHEIVITVDTLARACRCPYRCPPELAETYPRLHRPSFSDMAVSLTGHHAGGQTFATRTFLPDDFWFIDTVLFQNIYMAGHKIQRRHDYLTALYAFYTGCWVSIPVLIWSVMRLLYDSFISRKDPKRSKVLPFGHLITQILLDQRYRVPPDEEPLARSSFYRRSDWNKSYNALIRSLQEPAVEATAELEEEEAAQAQPAPPAAADIAADDAPVGPATDRMDIDLERPAEEYADAADDADADDTSDRAAAQERVWESSSEASLPESLVPTPGFGTRLQTLEEDVAVMRADITAHRAEFTSFRADVMACFADLSSRLPAPAPPATADLHDQAS